MSELSGNLPVIPLGTSAARTLRTCERKFVYAEVEQIEPISPPVPQKLGSWFHLLVAAYYLSKADPKRPPWQSVYVEMNNHWRGQRDAMRGLGVEVPDDGLDALPDQALRLMDAYVYHYGTLAPHLEDFDVVAVEAPYTVDVSIQDRVIVRARATTDAVIRDRRGQLWILETKTGKSFPYGRRMRLMEPQVTLQMVAAENELGEPVAGAIYNWIRTSPPVGRRMINQDGKTISKAKQYTDYLTFLKTLNALGLDPKEEPYAGKLRELRDPTTSRFFKRVLVHRTKRGGRIALANHARLGLRAERLRRRPHQADRRSEESVCNMCVFADLCEAEYVGDRDDARRIRERFRPRTDERSLLRMEAELADGD